MKNATLTIYPPEIKSVSFNNTFKQKPGEKLALGVKTSLGIRLNPNAPTEAIVFVKVTASDKDDCMKMEVETISKVSASTFIDNLDKEIQKGYVPSIMAAVNEKVKSCAFNLGISFNMPAPKFQYVEFPELEAAAPGLNN